MGFYNQKRPQAQLELYALFARFGLGLDSYDFLNELYKTIRRKTRIERISVFAYSVENKGLYNKFTPWIREKNKWYLNNFNPLYWKKYKEWLELNAKRKIKLNLVAFPGAYGEIPFKKNYNGVYGLLDPKALKFQKRYIRRLCRMARNILGDNWTLRLSNEMSGRQETGKRHQEWFLAVEEYIPIDRVIGDVSHSDYIAAYLCEEFGKEEWDRRLWIEQHGFSIIPHLRYRGGGIWRIILGSGWKKVVLSSDGSGCVKDSEDTEICPQGFHVPYTGFRGSSADEMFAFCKTAWKEARSAGKKLMIADLPMEVFFWNEDGILEEDFSRIDIERLKAMKRAWNRLKAISRAWGKS